MRTASLRSPSSSAATAAALGAAAVLAAASMVFAADPSAGPQPSQRPQQSQQSQQDQPGQQSRQQSGQQYDRSSDRSSDNPSASAGQANGQNAPEGWVLLDQRVVYLMAKEPQAHLLRAHVEMNKDPKAAAAECRIAADYLDMQATQAKKQQQDHSQLKQCAQDLRSLADRIGDKSGSEQDATKLFGRVNYTLARAFNDQARAALKKDDLVRAGHDLESAAESFRQCLVWSNQQPQQKAAQAIDRAASIAPALIMAPNAQQNEPQTAGQRQSPDSSNGASNDNHHNNGSNANGNGSNANGSGNAANASSGSSPSSSDLKQQAQQAAQALSQQLDQRKNQFQKSAQSSNAASNNNSASNNNAAGTAGNK